MVVKGYLNIFKIQGRNTLLCYGGPIIRVASRVVLIDCRCRNNSIYICVIWGIGCFMERFKISISHELVHGCGPHVVCGHAHRHGSLLLTTQRLHQRVSHLKYGSCGTRCVKRTFSSFLFLNASTTRHGYSVIGRHRNQSGSRVLRCCARDPSRGEGLFFLWVIGVVAICSGEATIERLLTRRCLRGHALTNSQ